MWSYVSNLLIENIFFIVPILVLFVIFSISSLRVRHFVLYLLIGVISISIVYLVNKYSANNSTIRTILVGIITLCCHALEVLVSAFVLNVQLFEITYSSGLYEVLYVFMMGNLISDVISFIHITLRLSADSIKRAYTIQINHIIGVFTYIKHFIVNSIFGSFYQIMRI